MLESTVSNILNKLGYDFEDDIKNSRLERMYNDFKNERLEKISSIINLEADSKKILSNIVYHVYNSPIRSDNNLSTITKQVNQVIRLCKLKDSNSEICEVSENIVSDILNKFDDEFYDDSSSSSTSSNSL